MIHKILLFAFACFSFGKVNACDVCASGGAGNYVGIVPNFSKNMIGLRAQFQSATFQVHELNTNGTSQIEADQYFRSDLWLRYFLTKRLQAQVVLPFQVNRRSETERSTTINGLGDLSTFCHYTLINRGDSINIRHKWTWTLGGGFQLPTGKYQQRDETKAMLPGLFQIGSGSYGLMVNQNLGYRFKAIGFATQYQFTHLTENEIGFKRGAVHNASLLCYYWYRKDIVSLLPSLGIVYSSFGYNQNYGVSDPFSGGENVSTSIGLDLYYLSWVLQTNGYLSIYQDMKANMPQGNWQISIGISRFF